MTKQSVLRKIKELSKTISRDNLNRYVKNHFPDIWQFIYDNTKNLDKFAVKDNKNKQISIFERLYCIKNNLIDRPHCCNCHANYVSGFNKVKNEYNKWCSPRCQATDKSCINKSKQTRQLKYGSPSYNGNDKAKLTRTKKYGSYHSKDFGEKVKETKLKNHGSATYVNINKCKATKLLRYGSETYNNKQKNKTTRKTNTYKILTTNKYVIPLFSLEDFISSDKHTIFKWKCKKCGNEFLSRINYNLKAEFNNNELIVRCINCFPYKEIKVSNEENEIFEFIKNIYNKILLKNNRDVLNGYELDIVIPDKKLAIEFDGLYWHSDIHKDSKYHLTKTNILESKNIQLIHIFEDEWLNKKDIVKSKIKNLLGIYDKTIFARKCVVKEVDSKTSKQFQDNNHLQGAINSKVNIGLYFNNELVSLMTFGKCRFDKKYEWELLRFCNKLGYHIPGGAGKLLKYFEENYKPKSLVSYADRRWSQGKLYKAIGFQFKHISQPNYWYIGKNYENRYSRQMFQKHKLKNILEKYDENLSEVQNMKNNGYSRIFDCGNIVFIKQYN